ncbi:hypothetical protein RFI_21541, partial [Reticulomyxa filosa]
MKRRSLNNNRLELTQLEEAVESKDDAKQDDNWYDKFLEKTQKGAKTTKKTRQKHHGRMCYVDPNELFPQATYFVSQTQRPNYYAESHEQDQEVSVSSVDKIKEEAITTPETKPAKKGEKLDTPLLVLTDTLLSDAKGSMDTHGTKESANQGDTFQSENQGDTLQSENQGDTLQSQNQGTMEV